MVHGVCPVDVHPGGGQTASLDFLGPQRDRLRRHRVDGGL